jgi:hypothetical protein
VIARQAAGSTSAGAPAGGKVAETDVVVKALSDVLVEGVLLLLGDCVLVLDVVPWLGMNEGGRGQFNTKGGMLKSRPGGCRLDGIDGPQLAAGLRYDVHGLSADCFPTQRVSCVAVLTSEWSVGTLFRGKPREGLGERQ